MFGNQLTALLARRHSLLEYLDELLSLREASFVSMRRSIR